MANECRPSRTFLALALAALSLAACGGGPPELAEDGSPPRLGPAERDRLDRLAEALEGLVFSDGRVRPTPGQRPGGDAVALIERGRRQWAAGRRVAAVEDLARAVAAAPERPEAYEHLGRALRGLGETGKALDVLRTALDLADESSRARAELAYTLEFAGRYSEALDSWSHVTDDAEAEARMAVDLYYLGDREATARHLAAAGDRAPTVLRSLLATGEPPRARLRAAGDVTVEPAVRVDTGGTSHAAETSVAAGASGHVVAAWNDLREDGGVDAWSLGVGLSTDGGATWSDFILRPAGNVISQFEGDPMTAYDPRTGSLWAGGITFLPPPRNIFVARKPPGSTSFEPAVLIHQGDSYDKGWLAAGPAPGQPDTTRLYVAYSLGLQVSQDLGATWSAIRPLDFGVGYLPRIGPQGELYVAYWAYGTGVMLQRSFDEGQTLSDPIEIATRMDVWGLTESTRFPGRFRVPPLSYLAVDPNDGTLYAVYFDTTALVAGQANVDLYLTRSEDQGDTWTTPQVINGDGDPPGDQLFPWLEVGANGRLHLLFLDSRHTVQDDDDVNGFFDVYYATSDDHGESWTEVRLTPGPFNSADADWPGFEQFLGDFMGLTVADDHAVAVYPSTQDGDLDIFARTIRVEEPLIFADGFETGTTEAWSASVP